MPYVRSPAKFSSAKALARVKVAAKKAKQSLGVFIGAVVERDMQRIDVEAKKAK